MKSSLRTRLILSFVVIIIATVGSFALLGRVSINQWFSNMVLEMGKDFAQRASVFFSWYYIQNGNWEGVENLLLDARGSQENHPWPPQQSEIPPGNDLPGISGTFPGRGILTPRDDRLLLLDADKEVVYDSNPDAGSVDLLVSNLDAGVQITVNDEVVGTVIAASSVGVLNSFQQAYLQNVNQFVLVGGILAIVVAIGWGAWLAVRIVRPVKALSEASLKLANGDYSQRIPVTSEDELGEMTQAFNRMASELERQEMLRRRGLADVAHELRTPLSVLQIDLESIEDGLIEADAETIDRLQLEVTSLSNLVEDLRILSLADAGELKLDDQPLEINGLIEINARRIERTAAEKGIDLVLDLAPGEYLLSGDELRLSQVLLNLFSNAIQYTPAGGKIYISSRLEGDCVRIVVRDTGEGIAAEDLPHIFERLYRSDRARARRNGGSGLGLSIARSVVETHGGRIWVESQPGKGSSFFIEIPVLAG